MLTLDLYTFPARFRMQFAHGSASRDTTENVICSATLDGTTGWGEGCPRAYVTGETVEGAAAFFDAHRAAIQSQATDLAGLRDWMAAQEPAIAQNPAAFSAIELALLDLFARRVGEGIEGLLDLSPPKPVRISAVFGVTSRRKTRAMAAGYRLFGMADAKVKLSNDPEGDRKRLNTIRRWLGPRARLRVDANNLFRSRAHCIAHMTGLDMPIWAIEEPLPARDFEGMAAVAQATGAKIILDESATGLADLAEVEGPGLDCQPPGLEAGRVDAQPSRFAPGPVARPGRYHRMPCGRDQPADPRGAGPGRGGG